MAVRFSRSDGAAQLPRPALHFEILGSCWLERVPADRDCDPRMLLLPGEKTAR